MNKSIGSQEMAKIKAYLGIDFGKAKIGLAIADEETKMAFAFDTLKNDAEFWKNLKEIVACENVKMIVVGMTEHGKDPEGAKEKWQFGQKVVRETGIEVLYHEEMFTTKMAHENIKMHGGKNIAATDDQESARIILQSWLDKNELFEKSVEALKHTHTS